jgi:hypothetical protein
MPRVSDVDTVAPDDMSPIVPAPKVDPVSPTSPAPKTSSSKSNIVADSIYKIMGHGTGSLSSLLIRPHVFDFEERDDDEEVLVVARQHWFTNVRWIMVAFFMLMVPTLFRFVPTLIAIPVNYQFVAYLFWYLITFTYSFEKFLSWYFNVYLITTKRVVDIDFNNLLTKKYSEAGLGAIQDVSSSVIGAIPTMFNYGNVLIQTASEINELEFDRVPNPEKIIKVLQELRDHQQGGNL